MDVRPDREEPGDVALDAQGGGAATGDEAVDAEDRRDRSAAQDRVDPEGRRKDRGRLVEERSVREPHAVGGIGLADHPGAAVDAERDRVGPPEDDARTEEAAGSHRAEGAPAVPVEQHAGRQVEPGAEGRDRRGGGRGAGLLEDADTTVDAVELPLDAGYIGADTRDVGLQRGDVRAEARDELRLVRGARRPRGDVEAPHGYLPRRRRHPVARHEVAAHDVLGDHHGPGRCVPLDGVAPAGARKLFARDRAEALVAGDDELLVDHLPARTARGRQRTGDRDRLPRVERDVPAVAGGDHGRRTQTRRQAARGAVAAVARGAERAGALGHRGTGRRAELAAEVRGAAIAVRGAERRGVGGGRLGAGDAPGHHGQEESPDQGETGVHDGPHCVVRDVSCRSRCLTLPFNSILFAGV